MTYLSGSVWIVVRHVEAVYNKTKEIKTVILEWTLKVPQPWHIFRYMLNHCRGNRHKGLQKTSEGGLGACSHSLALTLTAGSLQVPNPLPKLMMFLAWHSWPYLYGKIMCRWSLVAISTSYSLIPYVHCFLMNSEMVFKLARLGWEAQEVLKLFCITLGRKAIECATLCPPVRTSESHSAFVKVQWNSKENNKKYQWQHETCKSQTFWILASYEYAQAQHTSVTQGATINMKDHVAAPGNQISCRMNPTCTTRIDGLWICDNMEQSCCAHPVAWTSADIRKESLCPS